MHEYCYSAQKEVRGETVMRKRFPLPRCNTTKKVPKVLLSP